MPYYLMLTTLTNEGRRVIKENPDRLKEVNKEIELMGIKVVDQYALLGQYDFANILQAANNELVAKAATELSARGTIQTTTMAAMAIDDFIATLKKHPSQMTW